MHDTRTAGEKVKLGDVSWLNLVKSHILSCMVDCMWYATGVCTSTVVLPVTIAEARMLNRDKGQVRIYC
jgi:hypothetical protein